MVDADTRRAVFAPHDERALAYTAELPLRAMDSYLIERAGLEQGFDIARYPYETLLVGPLGDPHCIGFNRTSSSLTPLAAEAMLKNRTIVREVLRRAGVPTLDGTAFRRNEIARAVRYATSIGFPVRVSEELSAVRRRSRLASDADELRRAWKELGKRRGGHMVVEEAADGATLRCLVVDGTIITATTTSGPSAGNVPDPDDPRVVELVARASASFPGFEWGGVDVASRTGQPVVRHLRASPSLAEHVAAGRWSDDPVARLMELHTRRAGSLERRDPLPRGALLDAHLRVRGLTDPNSMLAAFADFGRACGVEFRSLTVQDGDQLVASVRASAHVIALLDTLACAGGWSPRTPDEVTVQRIGPPVRR